MTFFLELVCYNLNLDNGFVSYLPLSYDFEGCSMSEALPLSSKLLESLLILFLSSLTLTGMEIIRQFGCS